MWETNHHVGMKGKAMSKTYLGNAFSLGMLPYDDEVALVVTAISPSDIPADAESVVGHPDTAALYTKLLERPIAMNRVTTKLLAGDVLFVGQYSGARLPEGATSLPEGAYIKWLKVEVATEE